MGRDKCEPGNGRSATTVMGNEIDLIISEKVKLIASEQIEIAHQ